MDELIQLQPKEWMKLKILEQQAMINTLEKLVKEYERQLEVRSITRIDTNDESYYLGKPNIRIVTKIIPQVTLAIREIIK